MRPLLIALFLPAPALAHVGHMGEYAGHDHWVAGAAIGIAVGIGLWQAAKDRKARQTDADSQPEDEDTSPEEQSA